MENPNNFKAKIKVTVLESDYEWSDNPDGTVTITRYTGTDTDITIPDTLDEKTVTEIGVRAFESKGLTSVVIPQSVTSIRAFAFWGNNLTGTLDLTSENLVEIAERAFERNNLTKVIIGKNIQRISYMYSFSPFALNENLESIIVEDENETFEDMGGRGIYHPELNFLI